MKLLKKSAISLALLAAAQGAAANQWNVGVFAGQSSYDDINEICSPIAFIGLGCGDVEDTDTALGITVGYNITDNWGFEFGYIDLGEFTTELTSSIGNSTIGVDASVGYIAGVGTLPLNDKFSISARLGAFTASGDVNSSGLVSRSTEFEEDSAAIVGASLNYLVTEQLSLEVRYDNLDDFDLAAVGLKYHF